MNTKHRIALAMKMAGLGLLGTGLLPGQGTVIKSKNIDFTANQPSQGGQAATPAPLPRATPVNPQTNSAHTPPAAPAAPAEAGKSRKSNFVSTSPIPAAPASTPAAAGKKEAGFAPSGYGATRFLSGASEGGGAYRPSPLFAYIPAAIDEPGGDPQDSDSADSAGGSSAYEASSAGKHPYHANQPAYREPDKLSPHVLPAALRVYRDHPGTPVLERRETGDFDSVRLTAELYHRALGQEKGAELTPAQVEAVAVKLGGRLPLPAEAAVNQYFYSRETGYGILRVGSEGGFVPLGPSGNSPALGADPHVLLPKS